MCLFALKELLELYHSHNTTIFMCFIDASKAFDYVNHEKLFDKLYKTGVLKCLIRILAFWYAQQRICVKFYIGPISLL